MEILKYFARSDDYCSACLHSSSEVPLLPNNANEFFSSILVNVLTPWLCNRCSGILQAYHELRGKAVRAQTLLSDILLNTEMVEAKKEFYISELNYIKSIPKHVHIVVTAEQNDVSESQNCKVETHQSEDEIKIECTNPTEDIKDENCAVNEGNFKLESEDHPPACRSSSSASNECDSPDEDRIGDGLVKTVGYSTTKAKKATGTATRHDGKPLMILETDARVILDEDDDVLSTDIFNLNVKQIKITEEEYRKWIRERLQTDEYLKSKLKCNYCAISWERYQPFSRHKNRHSKNIGPYRCHLCTQYLPSDHQLFVHMRSHVYHYRCVECGLHSNNRRHMADHYFSKHTQIEFRCKYCDFTRRRPSCVAQHIYKSHVQQRMRVECKICLKIVLEKCLTQHMRTHTNELAVEVNCTLCDKKLKNQNTLKQHMELYHLRLSGEECPVCHKWIMPRSKKSHARTHSEASWLENVTCALCNQEFVNEYTLSSHMNRKHLGVAGKYECHDCGKGFYTKSELRSHTARVHMKICSFQCTMCKEKFVAQSQLKAHVLRIHHKIQAAKDKMCDVCGKGFSTLALLKNHRLIHTGERPHSCAQCGRTFRQRAAMRTHVKLVHMGIKYKDLLASRKKQKKVCFEEK